MHKFIPCLVLAALCLVRCMAANLEVGPVSTRVVVSESDVLAFLEKLETSHYHDLKRVGTETFQQGRFIPNYQTVFEGFPAHKLPGGQVRYDLLLIEGEAGMAWIHLFLEEDTGQIIEFSAGDATF